MRTEGQWPWKRPVHDATDLSLSFVGYLSSKKCHVLFEGIHLNGDTKGFHSRRVKSEHRRTAQ